MDPARHEKKSAERTVGASLASLLPDDPRPWYRVPHLLRLNLILLIPLVSSGCIGYDGSMMNGLQTLPQWRDYFAEPRGALLGAMNAVYPAGKVVSMFLVTWVGDRYGRKPTMAVGAVTCVAFAVMQALSRNMETFIASRALLGFCTSFLSQPSPILITELAYPTHRGKLTALYQTSFYLGAIIASWCTFGTFRMSTTWAWRIPSLLQGALPLLQCLTIYTLPESPRWLVAQGRHTDARRILTTYHAGGDASSPLVAFEMAEIEGALTHEADTSAHSWLDLVRTPANRRRTLIAAVVGWFAQWNGAGVISYYLFLVLNGIGITAAREQTLINALLQVTNWLAAIFIGALMVDRLGRRTLFLVSTGGMLLSYSVWTGLSVSFNETRDAVTGRVVVAFVFVTYFFYAIAWAPLLQAYTVEIYPYTLRGRGLSAMYVFSFVGLVVANQVNAIAMEAIGWRYYLVFVCILAMLMVVIWFLFPETKGHTLEEIREVFEGRAEGKLADVAEARVDEKRKRDVEQVEVA